MYQYQFASTMISMFEQSLLQQNHQEDMHYPWLQTTLLSLDGPGLVNVTNHSTYTKV